MYVYMYICMHTYIHVYIHTHTYIYVCWVSTALSSRRRAPSLPSNMALRRSNSGHRFTTYGCVSIAAPACVDAMLCGILVASACGWARLSHEKESACSWARLVSTAWRTEYTGERPHACKDPTPNTRGKQAAVRASTRPARPSSSRRTAWLSMYGDRPR